MQVRENEKAAIQQISAPILQADRNDPFAYFTKVIRGEIKMTIYALSSPENNEMVMQILEAAKSSAKSGKTIMWDQFYKNK
jgi:PHD/YefM family antitoxin component YafN of YafNO toxin-antitoxin module